MNRIRISGAKADLLELAGILDNMYYVSSASEDTNEIAVADARPYHSQNGVMQ